MTLTGTFIDIGTDITWTSKKSFLTLAIIASKRVLASLIVGTFVCFSRALIDIVTVLSGVLLHTLAFKITRLVDTDRLHWTVVHVGTAFVRIITPAIEGLSEKALLAFAIKACRANTLFILTTECFISALALVTVSPVPDETSFTDTYYQDTFQLYSIVHFHSTLSYKHN